MVVEKLWPDQQLHRIGQQPMHLEPPQSVGETMLHLFVIESMPNGVRKVMQLESLS